MKLKRSFYEIEDVVKIAKELIGKVIVTKFDDITTSGIIVETEAYAGIEDRASHAYGNRRTNRTEVMYAKGGTAYVYLCYGIHHLFNVVTNVVDIPHAVLIRAIEPIEGVETMLERRNKKVFDPSLTAGPGCVSQALGISTVHSGYNLTDATIFIENRKLPIGNIIAATRVGVAYAKEDALLPYRFYLEGNKFVSRGKGL